MSEPVGRKANRLARACLKDLRKHCKRDIKSLTPKQLIEFGILFAWMNPGEEEESNNGQ